ncbi:MAG: hypothetical protein ACM3JD_01420 [Rudaea sp.]
MKRFIYLGGLAAVLALTLMLAGSKLAAKANAVGSTPPPACQDNAPLCTEVYDFIGHGGEYTGHDEPSLLFYSHTAGSGNSNSYRLTLPKDPPTLPRQDGTGGTFNFQLHPAFWFGMAMCDDQSAPNPGGSALAGPEISCTPDSDSNIYTSTNPADPNYIGKHPGGAYMELQFYAPGWIKWPPGASCDPSKWCAALNIDGLSENQNTGAVNNNACLGIAGIEPVNFAFITRSGVAQAPANPIDATLATYTPEPSVDLMMQSGDTLTVDLHDTPAGFKVIIHDLTKGTVGSMTASVANGFGQVVFDPNATTCAVNHAAYHPMYASSSEDTRLTWTAHSYNVAFSDEIGHFEYCNSVTGQGGDCTSAGVNDPSGVDDDDEYCFAPPFALPIQSTRVKVGGCMETDSDFDGVSYQNTWPGTLSNPTQDALLNPSPIRFSSPRFNGNQNYDRASFETDLPRIEFATNPPCNRTTGAGCTNPPAGATFYPIYTTGTLNNGCVWQLGGPYIPGTTDTFGGNSAAEYGSLLSLAYPVPGGVSYRYNDYRNTLSSNPCSQ